MSEASYSKRTPSIISGVQPKPFNNPPPPISGHPPKTAPAPPMSGEKGAAQFKQRGAPAVTNAGVSLTNNINNAVKQGARTTVVENPVTGRRVETLADLLWKLPQPCKPNTNEILEKCFKEFSQIVQINKNSTGEQAEYDKFISELTAKLEAEKTKIIEAKGSRRQVIQQNYDAKMRQLGQAKEAQLAAVKDNIYKNYDNLLEKHRNKYVPLISNIEKAYNYVNSICSEYGITHKKFPVVVNKSDIDINANPSQIALYAKTCAEAINELNSAETDSVKIINKLNSIDDTKKKLIGGGALIGAILAAPVALAGATALIAKQGLMEHQIGSKVKELSTDIMRCNLILKRMLAGMKEQEELDYPKKEPFDGEYERMYSSTLNSFKGEETKTTDIYLREIDGIKNEDISGQISTLAANYDNEKSRIDSHFSNKIVNNGTIVSQRTRDLFSVLNEYVQDQPTILPKLK